MDGLPFHSRQSYLFLLCMAFNLSRVSPLISRQSYLRLLGRMPRTFSHDDVTTLKYIPHYWHFVGIHKWRLDLPHKGPSNAELLYFVCCQSEWAVEQTVGLPLIWGAMTLICLQCNVCLLSRQSYLCLLGMSPPFKTILPLLAGYDPSFENNLTSACWVWPLPFKTILPLLAGYVPSFQDNLTSACWVWPLPFKTILSLLPGYDPPFKTILPLLAGYDPPFKTILPLLAGCDPPFKTILPLLAGYDPPFKTILPLLAGYVPSFQDNLTSACWVCPPPFKTILLLLAGYVPSFQDNLTSACFVWTLLSRQSYLCLLGMSPPFKTILPPLAGYDPKKVFLTLWDNLSSLPPFVVRCIRHVQYVPISKGQPFAGQATVFARVIVK